MSAPFALCFAVLFAAVPAFAGPPVRTAAFGRLPMTFEQNTGRYDKRVQFLTRTRGATVFITNTEAVMVLRGQARGERRRDGLPRSWRG